MPTSRRDANLARLASRRRRRDHRLDQLLRFADLPGVSFGFRVTFVMDGRFIEGMLAPSEVWAEIGDEKLKAAFDEAARTEAAGWSRDDWQEVRETVMGQAGFEALLARRRERDRREQEKWQGEDIGAPELEEALKRGGELSRGMSKVGQPGRRATRPHADRRCHRAPVRRQDRGRHDPCRHRTRCGVVVRQSDLERPLRPAPRVRQPQPVHSST